MQDSENSNPVWSIDMKNLANMLTAPVTAMGNKT